MASRIVVALMLVALLSGPPASAALFQDIHRTGNLQNGVNFIAGLMLVSLASDTATADVFSDISNAINSATNTVSNGVNTAANAVSSGVSTAVNAVGNGLNTAANATQQGLDTALNKTGQFINTATSTVKDGYQTTSKAVDSVTNSVEAALSPAASRVETTFDNLGNSISRVTSNAYQGVVQYGKNNTGASSPSSQTTPAQNSSVDATSAASMLNALTANSTGFISVANSVLVAIGQNKSAGVETAFRNLINNRTGETDYPSSGLNDTVSLSLAEAVVTAIVTANNYTVTVGSNTVNATQVVNVFLAGLQDAITPCAKNVSATSAANTTGTYFNTIAQNCCYLVSQPLKYSASLSQSNTVGIVFSDGLTRSQQLGQAPSLDLTRCVDSSATS